LLEIQIPFPSLSTAASFAPLADETIANQLEEDGAVVCIQLLPELAEVQIPPALSTAASLVKSADDAMEFQLEVVGAVVCARWNRRRITGISRKDGVRRRGNGLAGSQRRETAVPTWAHCKFEPVIGTVENTSKIQRGKKKAIADGRSQICHNRRDCGTALVSWETK
jgi:hypothetical protein